MRKLKRKKPLTDKERELMRDPSRWLPINGNKITYNHETVGTLTESGRFTALKKDSVTQWKWSGFSLPKQILQKLKRKAKWVDIIYEPQNENRGRILFRTTPGEMLEHGKENGDQIVLARKNFMHAYSEDKKTFLGDVDLHNSGQQRIGDYE